LVLGGPDVFKFIADPNLVWRDDAETKVLFCERNGQKVGVGVRADPATVIANISAVIERLRSGMNPLQAMQRH
jgi:hypothetical protein